MGDLLRQVLRRDTADTASGRSEPDAEAARLLASVHRGINGRYLSEPDLRALPEVQALFDADEAVRATVLLELVAGRLGDAMEPGTLSLLGMLSRRKLSIPAWQLGPLLADLDGALREANRWKASGLIDQVAVVIERSVGELSGEDRAVANQQVERIIATIEADIRIRVSPVALKRLRAVLPSDDGVDVDPIAIDDGIGPAFRALLAASDEPVAALAPFVAHLVAATKGRPSATWTAKAGTLAAALRDAPALLRALLQSALDADDQVVRYDYGSRVHESARWVAPTNEPIVRNVVWAAAAGRDPEAIPLLRALALKTVAMIGGQFGYPRSLTVALACPGAIAAIGAPASLTALQGLQRSTRHGSLLKETGKAIDSLAAASNVSRSELLETAVERHDLDAAGRRELAVGAWTAVLQVTGAGDVVTTWTDPNGTVRAALLKTVRDAEPAAVKAVTAATKAIKDTIGAERTRLDRLFVEDRRWPVAVWRDRYLGHPITGSLTRSLIWRFGTVVGMPTSDGTAAVGAGGGSTPIPDDAEVSLWHPIEATEGEVRAWREWLMAERLAQPLKQAFREVYLVTPAEVETDIYSNRFAAHVIRQVQARALMKGRGWSSVPLAWWDNGIDHGVARRSLEAFAVRAELFYDPILDVEPTTSNLYPYCTTDQVRFFRAGTDDALHVAEVPRVAFSEVMRDVDLFVGVTSIGADPQWLDRGERRFDTYWQHWGFGDLGQPASIRREVIEKLLPALKIADRSRLTDRYLEVDGTLHTYRIHLGSGNILMSPNDRYLCIVAARHPGDDRLFLPFEDDPMLSLILSKAFLLVDDTAITDPSIVRQLKGD